MTGKGIIAEFNAKDGPRAIAKAQGAVRRAKQMHALSLMTLRASARNSGMAAGQAKKGHDFVRQQMMEREKALLQGDATRAQAVLRQAGAAAVGRNVVGRQALTERKNAEVARFATSLWARISQLRRVQLVQLQAVEGARRSGMPAAQAAEKAARAMEAADKLEAQAAALQAGNFKIPVPAAMSAEKTQRIAKAAGIQMDAHATQEVLFKHPAASEADAMSPATAGGLLASLPTSIARSRIMSVLPPMFRDPVEDPVVATFSSPLAGLLAGDLGGLGFTVSIRDPQTGQVRTTEAKSVDSATTAATGSGSDACDWWCKFKTAFETVGPSVGAGVAAAGGAISQKDATAGAVVTGAGGFLAALSSLLKGETEKGFEKGQSEPPPGTKQSPEFPWKGILTAVGIVGAGLVIGKAVK